MDSLSKIEGAISDHAVTLGILVNSVSDIKDFMKESVESQKRLEITMEKLANFEMNTKDIFNRVFTEMKTLSKRIEHIEADIDVRESKVKQHIESLEPKVAKGETVHNGLVWTAKTLGYFVVAMLFFVMIWAIKASDYTPKG